MSILIVPIDFSPNAENALDQALLLAHQTGDSVELLHAVELEQADSIYFKMKIMEEISNAEARLKSLAFRRIRALDLPGNINWQVSVHYSDNLAASIEERFHQLSARLVVMGTAGINSWTDRIIGSTTSALVGKAVVPVLVIPAGWAPKPLKKLSVCLTPAQVADAEAQLREWSNWMGSELEGFYFTAVPGERYVGKCSFPVTAIPDPIETPLYQDLVAFSWALEEGALVMFVHGRSFFDKIFDSSTTEQVAARIGVPLLALPARK